MNRTEPPNEGAHWRPARSQKNRACSRHEHRVHPRFIVVLFCLAVARLARPRRAQPNQQRRCSVEWPRIVRGKLFFFEPLDVTHSDTIRAFGFLFVKAIPRPHRSLPPRVLVSALAQGSFFPGRLPWLHFPPPAWKPPKPAPLPALRLPSELSRWSPPWTAW